MEKKKSDFKVAVMFSLGCLPDNQEVGSGCPKRKLVVPDNLNGLNVDRWVMTNQPPSSRNNYNRNKFI